jgi:hypothetical protein
VVNVSTAFTSDSVLVATCDKRQGWIQRQSGRGEEEKIVSRSGNQILIVLPSKPVY